MIATNTSTSAQIALADELTALTESLQHSTVQVRGRGPGGGSGVIWRDGLIITNAHVARGDEATVELWDGRVFEAKVTARDTRRDLASLSIEATGLPVAAIGDSSALRVGELVLAVGNPLGFVGAVTTGIVHTISESDEGQSWVRADVHLAPGNSGGPLSDAQGRVIGINAMIAGGLGLAVPSNAVEAFLRRQEQPISLGVAVRAVIVKRDQADALGLLLVEIAEGSLAERSGFFLGDILLAADGKPFREPDDLIEALRRAKRGEAVSLEFTRGGQSQSITITAPDAEKVAA